MYAGNKKRKEKEFGWLELWSIECHPPAAAASVRLSSPIGL